MMELAHYDFFSDSILDFLSDTDALTDFLNDANITPSNLNFTLAIFKLLKMKERECFFDIPNIFLRTIQAA